MLESPSHPVNEACATLSARELEVLAMTAQGLTNTQMSSRLQVSVHAVKFHLSSIYRKLGAANRTEAAVIYLRDRHEPAKTRPL